MTWEPNLGIPVLGTIPASTDVELLMREEEGAQDELLIESVSALRTTLLRQAQKNPLQVIMISSADQGRRKEHTGRVVGEQSRASRATNVVG